MRETPITRESLPMMVPLGLSGADWVRKSVEAPHRSTAFRHAALHARPGLWGDHPEQPRSVIWLREGDLGGWEAFAAGRASPAIDWLAARCEGRPIALLAPPSWEGPVRMKGGRVERSVIQTRSFAEPPDQVGTSRIAVRRLGLQDAPAFEAIGPAWSLRSWGDYATLIERGAAFGVEASSHNEWLSVAWTYEADGEHDKIAVATRPRYRRLGLGRATAWSLVEHVLLDRQKAPLWVTTSSNTGSTALAGSLGFANPVNEILLRWTWPPGDWQSEQEKHPSEDSD